MYTISKNLSILLCDFWFCIDFKNPTCYTLKSRLFGCCSFNWILHPSRIFSSIKSRLLQRFNLLDHFLLTAGYMFSKYIFSTSDFVSFVISILFVRFFLFRWITVLNSYNNFFYQESDVLDFLTTYCELLTLYFQKIISASLIVWVL